MKKLRPPRIKVSDFTRKAFDDNKMIPPLDNEMNSEMTSEVMSQHDKLSKDEYLELLEELQSHGLISYNKEEIGDDNICVTLKV